MWHRLLREQGCNPSGTNSACKLPYSTVRGQRYTAFFSPEPGQAVVGGHLYAVPSETARVGLKLKAPIWRCGTVVRDGPS